MFFFVIAGNDLICLKLLKMDGNGFKLLEIAEMAGNDEIV